MQITMNDLEIKLVEYECTPSLLELGDRTQTLDGVEHVESRMIKRIINATTKDLIREDAYNLMQIIKNNVYLTVKYEDPVSNMEETRIFVLQNNPSFKPKMWKSYRKFYQGVDLELKEKGAEQ